MRELCDIGAMTVGASIEPWVPDSGTFGARLALVRQRMRWNIKESAMACGISAGSWREWELAGRLPRNLDEVCTRIAISTGCNDFWLMTGRITPTAPNGGGQGAAVPPPGLEPGTCGLKVRRISLLRPSDNAAAA